MGLSLVLQEIRYIDLHLLVGCRSEGLAWSRSRILGAAGIIALVGVILRRVVALAS